MTKRSDLFEALHERQEGKCAICGEEIPGDRFASHIDRYPIPGKDGGEYVIDNTRLICLECDWEQEGNRPNSRYPQLKAAYKDFKIWQQLRGDFQRRKKAYLGIMKNTTKSPYITEDTLIELEDHGNYFEKKQKEAEKRMNALVTKTPEWKGFMKDSPGIGKPLAAFLVATLDPYKAKHASAFNKFFGYDPDESYNPGKGKLKSTLVASLELSICKKKTSPYRIIYDRYKEEGNSDGGTVRRVIKIWLSHLWCTWRKFEGLEVSNPYPIDHMGHSHTYHAEDFGWPKIVDIHSK